MNLAQSKEGTVLILAVAGRLDAVTAPVFGERVNRLIEGGETNLVLDFARLDYLSSAGLRAILGAAKKVPKSEGRLVVCNLTGMPREVFGISGFDGIFPMADSIGEALKMAS